MNRPVPRTGQRPRQCDQAARSVTVLLRILQLTAALSFAAVILSSAGTLGGTNVGPTAESSWGPPSAVFVIVARMAPSTTSGVTERRTLNVAVPESTSTIAAKVGVRFGTVGLRSTGNWPISVSAGPDCDCSLGSLTIAE